MRLKKIFLSIRFILNYKHTFWFENINEPLPFEWWVGNVLNVVGCPGINNVVFGIVNSLVGDVKSLFIGLFVNGSRSYNLGLPRFFFDVLELIKIKTIKYEERKKQRFLYLLDRRWRWLTFCAICDNESERLLLFDDFDWSNEELFPLIIVVGWIIPVNCCVVNVVVSLVNVKLFCCCISIEELVRTVVIVWDEFDTNRKNFNEYLKWILWTYKGNNLHWLEKKKQQVD